MLNNSIPNIISAVITLLISLTFHEFAHAWTATKFGDNTPKMFGRLTLNPLRHLDPAGSLMLIFAGFGWAKPVPINPQNIRRNSSAGLMLVAISGPFANFLLAAAAAIPIRFGWVYSTVQPVSFLPSLFQFTTFFMYTNLGLMFFNLLPIPPLDGEEILLYLLPPSWERSFETLRPYGPFLLIFFLFIGPMIGINLIDMVISPAIYATARFLLGGF
jgi:Zn-dependent protease